MAYKNMEYGGVQGSGTGHAAAKSKGPTVKNLHKTDDKVGAHGKAPNARKAPPWAKKSGDHKNR